MSVGAGGCSVGEWIFFDFIRIASWHETAIGGSCVCGRVG